MDMNPEEISQLDILVCQLENQGKSSYVGVFKPITCRLPVHQYVAVEALSRHTGMSKNKIICEMLEVALKQAIPALDSKNRKAFLKHQSEVLTELEPEGYGESGGDL